MPCSISISITRQFTCNAYESWARRFTVKKEANSEMAYCAPNLLQSNKYWAEKKTCLVFRKTVCCLNCWNSTVHLLEFASGFHFILSSLILHVFPRTFDPELIKAICVSEFNRKGVVRCFVQFRATLHVTEACVRKRNKAMFKWVSVWESLVCSNSSCRNYPLSRNWWQISTLNQVKWVAQSVIFRIYFSRSKLRW